MKLYSRGSTLLAVCKSDVKLRVPILVPRNNMCNMLLTRYMIMELGYEEGSVWMYLEV